MGLLNANSEEFNAIQTKMQSLMAITIGLQQVQPLQPTPPAPLVKLVVFVPDSHLEPVRQALFEHAYALGNYRDCSFAGAGEGTFTPQRGAAPAIGTVGMLERVAEHRLEILLQRDQLGKAIKTLLAAHPYEEPAFDCYPLLNEGPPCGLGRIGVLPEPCSLITFADQIRQRLGCGPVRLVGDQDRLIRKVALCSGSGTSLLKDALRAGADLLLTGDCKYHEAREAEACGIALLDAGHFATEILMVEAVQQFLQTALAAAGYQCELVRAAGERDPFQTR